MIKRTTLIYVLTALLAFTVMMIYGSATVFQWSLFVTVLVHLALLWWRGWLVDKSQREISELRKEFDEYRRYIEQKVDELAHRPIFPWDTFNHEKHLRA